MILPTLTEVAKKAGVSLTTASRVINDSYRDKVSDKTRQRVLQVVAEMGYRSSVPARALRWKKTFQYSLIIPNLAFSYMPEVVQGLQDVATRINYGCLLYLTHGDPALEEKVFDTVHALRVDGIIWMPSQASPGLRAKLGQAPVLEILNKSGLPGLSSIMVDQEYGGYLAARHLLALGHRHIAVSISSSGGHWLERLKGYARAAREYADVKYTAPITVTSIDWEQGVATGRDLLRMQPRPTALLAASDDFATGVLHAAAEAGLKAPRDLSVVGFGDIPAGRHSTPPLTTVGHPKREIGERAMQMLAALMNKEEVPDTVFKPMLVTRDSTAGRT